MNKDRFLFTSESVTEGHPDKVCDQISDAILDSILAQDATARVAVETLVTTGTVLVAGEISTNCYVDIPQIVRRTIGQIGYDKAELGFDHLSCGVLTAIQQQSPDIAMGVDKGGAGDQGMMFGYACKETPEYMPMPIMLAHRITRSLADLRKKGTLDYLCPDGKSQVSVEYENSKPVRIDTILISTHHSKGVQSSRIKKDLHRLIVKNPQIIPQDLLDSKTKFLVNPTGRFEVGGPVADTGLTGRKIIVDTYGGFAPHGGGAFSGKDPSKVDRSAAYMARYVAKNIVAAGLAERCQIQVAYAIGVAEPVSILVTTFGTSRYPDALLEKVARIAFDLTPKGIMTTLNLRRPIYLKTASYGHFGKADKGSDFPWEKLDKVQALKKALETVLSTNGNHVHAKA